MSTDDRYTFGDLVTVLAPWVKTPAEHVAMLEGRATWEAIRKWKCGHTGAPPWAIELMRTRAEQGAIVAAQTKIGPGQKAGTENLRKWHARKKD